MEKDLYRLPDSNQKVVAFCLWEEERKSLLVVPPVENVRGPTLVIAKRNLEGVFEDCDSNTFELEDCSAAMISVCLTLLIKDNTINQSLDFE